VIQARDRNGLPKNVWWVGAGAALIVLLAALIRTSPKPYLFLMSAPGVVLILVMLRRQSQAERLVATIAGVSGKAPLLKTLAVIQARFEDLSDRLSQTHPVTGLRTRERLLQEMHDDTCRPETRRLLGVIRFVDFDRLAAFDLSSANDALKQMADRLERLARTSHVICQVDRDCFALWLREDDAAEAAEEFSAIVQVARQEFTHAGSILAPTIEAASVTYPDDGLEPAHLLLRALGALAHSGRDQNAVGRPLALEAARAAFGLEQDLASAVVENQLHMVFQPVVDLSAGRLIGAEALLRWSHPTRGPISPAQFIPMAEASGLSDRFGLWVLNAACGAAKRWQDDGLGALKMAVNLSARQLLDPALFDKIMRTLARHRLPATMLELELTETAAMGDPDAAARLFGKLREAGVSIAIDDFGSGYSSLSYLKKLPFDKLKIDREFVIDVDSKRGSQAICKALIELGRGFDLKVLAEGVETKGEVDTLRRLGCSVFQGFYFSRPLSDDVFHALARDSAWLARLKARRPSYSAPLEDRLSA
jgi:EAL domain-containing protein (putative c-di-GMP-specific phosphodiesterase class I)/GGDEF domain-containing protein